MKQKPDAVQSSRKKRHKKRARKRAKAQQAPLASHVDRSKPADPLEAPQQRGKHRYRKRARRLLPQLPSPAATTLSEQSRQAARDASHSGLTRPGGQVLPLERVFRSVGDVRETPTEHAEKLGREQL